MAVGRGRGTRAAGARPAAADGAGEADGVASAACSGCSSCSSSARWSRPRPRSSSSLGPVPALVVLGLIVLAAVALGRTLRRSARTLDQLVRATERVQAGDYSVRVRSEGRIPWPVRSLVRGFETMVERLEADESQRRTLLADVSHELRTPLAVIAGELEAMIDGVRPADAAHLGADPRRDRGHGPAHRGPPDGGPVRGRHAAPASRADGPGRAHRGRRALVRDHGRSGRG